MEVNVIEGRKTIKFSNSTKVLVDIFRSTTSMPIILYRGAERIIPIYSVEEAKRMKSTNPDFVLVGERYGFKVPGFDYNNSPYELSKINFQEKNVIFTSTNGTLVLRKISGTGKIYISSFMNIEATVISLQGESRVDIVVSGRPGGSADEDYIFAEYLSESLQNKQPDFDDYAERIRKCHGARRLRIIGSARDIDASLKPNMVKFPVIFNGSEIVREE